MVTNVTTYNMVTNITNVPSLLWLQEHAGNVSLCEHFLPLRHFAINHL